MQKAFHDIHFDSIQVLRGLAALFVVAEHIRFLACGAFGVDIFFCISGFMIMFTTHKNTSFLPQAAASDRSFLLDYDSDHLCTAFAFPLYV